MRKIWLPLFILVALIVLLCVGLVQSKQVNAEPTWFVGMIFPGQHLRYTNYLDGAWRQYQLSYWYVGVMYGQVFAHVTTTMYNPDTGQWDETDLIDLFDQQVYPENSHAPQVRYLHANYDAIVISTDAKLMLSWEADLPFLFFAPEGQFGTMEK